MAAAAPEHVRRRRRPVAGPPGLAGAVVAVLAAFVAIVVADAVVTAAAVVAFGVANGVVLANAIAFGVVIVFVARNLLRLRSHARATTLPAARRATPQHVGVRGRILFLVARWTKYREEVEHFLDDLSEDETLGWRTVVREGASLVRLACVEAVNDLVQWGLSWVRRR